MFCEKTCNIVVSKEERVVIDDIMNILTDSDIVDLNNNEIVSVLLAIAMQDNEVVNPNGEVIEGINIRYRGVV